MLVISAGIAEIQTPRTDRSLPSMALDGRIPAGMTALLKSDKVKLSGCSIFLGRLQDEDVIKKVDGMWDRWLV
ncbi:hypothetical protein A1355_14645 [Methylomonas koyamae]|uniref:Uncharacterized protein n=1 Tax=Methylomonas koyamae TaxID=702114 RepID=A0A177N4Q6_9GAMM|nr:hypothetical protein A1355_14645 [Methylomonas koyamae]